MKHKTTTLLVVGDLIVVLLFSAIGRVSHQMTPDPKSVLYTALPFAVAWLIVGALVGTFKTASVEGVGRAFKMTILTVVLAAPLGVLLRSLLLGRMMILSFWIVGSVSLAVLMLAWRLLYAYVMKKAA
jgi:hypothetical protein